MVSLTHKFAAVNELILKAMVKRICSKRRQNTTEWKPRAWFNEGYITLSLRYWKYWGEDKMDDSSYVFSFITLYFHTNCTEVWSLKYVTYKYDDRFSGMWISIINIRRLWKCLIYMMGIFMLKQPSDVVDTKFPVALRAEDSSHSGADRAFNLDSDRKYGVVFTGCSHPE